MTDARVGPSASLQAAIDSTTSARLRDPRGFDAIVVGAGAAGGIAAMRLTQSGLNVLVLDAGWRGGFLEAPVRRITAGLVGLVANPRLQMILPPKLIQLGHRALRLAGRFHWPVQSRCYAWELAPGSFVDDRESPYIVEPGTAFNWYRAQQLGGKMIIPGHGRQYYRLSSQDLAPTDGLSPAWPLAPAELDSWYSLVERHLGLSGAQEHNPWVPDGEIATPLGPTPAEAQVMAQVRARWQSVQPILGRSASPPTSLDVAAATSRLFCRRGAVVRDVQVDQAGHASGVSWFDRATQEIQTACAPVVFLCASSLETTRILLSSRSARTPEGIGARSGVLGRYLMDHVLVSADGTGGALPDEPVASEPGRCVYLPRFDLRERAQSSQRGFGVQIYQWSGMHGKSLFTATSFSEMTPRAENRVTLDPLRRDAWGLPVLRIHCRHDEAELTLAAEQSAALRELGVQLGINLHRLDQAPAPPGSSIHECGTARMGESPENSVFNPHNESWDIPGLYATDGAVFPCQGTQNPTLTIMALTARACAHAAR